ncbi:MAG: methyl-accepting chemotaxis protein [Treponema sp.]
MTKRFSLKKKLILIFGALIAAASLTEGLFAVGIAKKAVTEKVEAHLTGKANDVAEIIDGRLVSFLQFLEGIARMPVFSDKNVSYGEKAAFLKKEVAYNSVLHDAAITDIDGTMYTLDGRAISGRDRNWIQAGIRGEHFITEPYRSRTDDKMIITFSVPIYNGENRVVGVLGAAALATWFSEQIADIVVGKTGYCYVLGLTGSAAAHRTQELVEKRANAVELAKTDSSYAELAALTQTAIKSDKSTVGYYRYKNVSNIASYAKIKTTGWIVIINAPVGEFMGTVDALRVSMFIIGGVILLLAVIVVFLTAQTMVKPIQTTVAALQNIAQGEGDLTVRLPVTGNDEITDLASYFNQTIAKIGDSIRVVGASSKVMEELGEELSSDMTETASAINEISLNIDGVKQQAMTQAASVTETAGTIEEIIRTIETLNGSIETQSASVVQSSAAVEEMVANIASITQSLEKSDNMVKNLAAATSEGKSTLLASNTVTQKIADESGGLIEASSVIQNIASQTNLLAMNAAIEAAHAGEAGKGFAVVADEIRKLAEEAGSQGKAITDTLKKLSDDINGLSDSSKIVEEKFNAIFQLSENVRAMSAQLTAAMREQENGSREVLAAIKNISAVTMEVKNGSEEMLVGGKGVAQEMQKLDQLTAVIKDSMNEMAAGVQQINNAVQEVNDLARKNKDSIEGLAEEVGKFKV